MTTEEYWSKYSISTLGGGRIINEALFKNFAIKNKRELDSLIKVYNDLAESHAKQVIEIGELTLLHQVANSSVDILSGEKSALESELLKAKESNDSIISILAALKLDSLEGRELLRQSLLYSKNDADFHDVINHNHTVEEFLNKK